MFGRRYYLYGDRLVYKKRLDAIHRTVDIFLDDSASEAVRHQMDALGRINRSLLRGD